MGGGGGGGGAGLKFNTYSTEILEYIFLIIFLIFYKL